MNKIQIFESKDFGSIRTVEIDGAPWFVGKDVAVSLGYLKPENAVATHVDSEDKTTTLIQGTGSNYKSKTVIINESGLYSLILSSKLPTAKQFKHWVTSEVLPSIRKHGAYMTDSLLDQAIENPDFMIGLLTKLKEEKASRLEAERQRNKLIHQSKLYTSSEIAKELGMKSAIALNNALAERGIQYKQNGTWLLYSKYADKDLVSIKQHVLDNGHIIYDRKFTGIGRDFILDLFQ